jgi:hypothetical protein
MQLVKEKPPKTEVLFDKSTEDKEEKKDLVRVNPWSLRITNPQI